MTPDPPVVKKGSRFESVIPFEPISKSPSTINQPITAITKLTKTSCKEALAFEPTTFSNVKNAIKISARFFEFTSTIKTRYALIPTMAKASFRTSDSHAPRPATVPTAGPSARSKK